MKSFPLYVETDPPLYVFARLLLSLGLIAYGRFEQRGLQHLPETGPALLVANHPSDFDPIFLGVSFRRTPHFMGDVVQFHRAFVGRCIKRLAAFPVVRGAVDRQALKTALDLLAAGEVVALFPEGDMYPDGPRPFERGIGFLAAQSGAPVIPCGITGAEKIRAGGGLHRPLVRFNVGPPVDLSGLTGSNHELYAAITQRVEQAVRGLLE